MITSNVSPSPSSPIARASPRQIIALDRLRELSTAGITASTGMNGDAVGTVGTHISYSNAHAGKNDFGGDAETYVFAHSAKVSEKRVPTVPTLPDLSTMLYSLRPGDDRYRDPAKGELVIGIYRTGETCEAALLYADPLVDLFWDVVREQHVKPPLFYLRLADATPAHLVPGA